MAERAILRSVLQKISLVLAGILGAAVLAEGVLRLGGAILLLGQGFGNMGGREAEVEVRVLCLGESTTQNQYPRMLESVLNSRGHGKKFKVIDKGVAGTNTGAILMKLDGYLEQYRPHVVVTMMGVNDGEWSRPLDEAGDGREALAERLKGWRIVKLARIADVAGRLKKIGEARRAFPAGMEGAGGRGRDAADIKEEDVLRRALASDPKNEGLHLELARLHMERQEWGRAEESCREALALNPRNEEAHLFLSQAYRSQGEWEKAERHVQRALELNPKREEVYLLLAQTEEGRGNWRGAEQNYQKALALSPRNEWTFICLGRVYQALGMPDRADECLQRASALGLKDENACIQVAWQYLDQKKWAKAAEAFQRALALNPENEIALDGMIQAEQGERAGRRGSGERREEQKRDGISPYFTGATVRNYRKMRDVLSGRKTKLVCVQYPMRRLEPLKNMIGERPGVFFVDNEGSFRRAVQERGYWTCFRDAFGGDFGHCTEAGNRLLAENIAAVILKEVCGFNEGGGRALVSPGNGQGSGSREGKSGD